MGVHLVHPHAEDDPTLALLPALLALAPVASGARAEFRLVTHFEAVCSKYRPELALAFALPADYEARSPAAGTGSGCAWGTREDLDKALKETRSLDFTSVERGIFWLRSTINVSYDPAAGRFDAFDGAGEEGIRAQLKKTGAMVLRFRRGSVGEFPTLEIVSKLGGKKAYMLYVGNTRFEANVLLASYHPPPRRSLNDDAVWQRFVEGLGRSEPR